MLQRSSTLERDGSVNSGSEHYFGLNQTFVLFSAIDHCETGLEEK